MLKTTFKKQEKSPKTLIFYFLIMSTCYILIHLVIYPDLPEDKSFLKYICSGLLGLTTILWLAAWLKDPGYI